MKPPGVEVVIVGGGPVGFGLALVLARYGVRSLVLERRARPTPLDESRAITWMPRGLELLDWLDLGDAFTKVGVRRTRHEFRTPNGRTLLAMRFDRVNSPHPYTLQLPQHVSETLLEQAARDTGLVEVRRGHQVTGVDQQPGGVRATVDSSAGSYTAEAPWGVGADGAGSRLRGWLGVKNRFRDYGADSVVADFEMDAPLPKEVSSIVFGADRAYGFFYFAPGRWRFIYPLKPGEDRTAMTAEGAVRALLQEKLPDARAGRFLWASAFRLSQGQSETYRKGRWLLAGDAAHAMGPSAGAGMMIGLLGAWRLGWRLAHAARGHPNADGLLADYDHEQHAASDAVQDTNALIFRNMVLRDRALVAARQVLLGAVGRAPAVAERFTAGEALTGQVLPVADAADAVRLEGLVARAKLGDWQVGRRVPDPALLARIGQQHIFVSLDSAEVDKRRSLVEKAREQLALPVEANSLTSSRKVGGKPAIALVRPDQHIVGLYERA